jgi:hypothetical protein
MHSGFSFGNLSMVCLAGDNESAGDHKALPTKLLGGNITMVNQLIASSMVIMVEIDSKGPMGFCRIKSRWRQNSIWDSSTSSRLLVWNTYPGLKFPLDLPEKVV